jgi:hypothetical protein
MRVVAPHDEVIRLHHVAEQMQVGGLDATVSWWSAP